MAGAQAEPLGLLISKCERFAELNDSDRSAIRALPVRTRAITSNSYIVRDGDVVAEASVLLQGYACRHKTSSNGGRQIVSFHIPGDILDVQHILLPQADHNIQTITDAVIATIPLKEMKRLIRQHPSIAEALWRDSLIDASIFREWVLNVGRRRAKSRIAHLLCEFAIRREVAGLGSPERFSLPMSQEQIGDATGLTAVHVNRMLQELHEEEVITRNRREIRIADWERMKQVADFEPQYLHAAAA